MSVTQRVAYTVAVCQVYIPIHESDVCHFMCLAGEKAIHRKANLPIVDMNVELNASSENLNKTHVLPTPESPINKSLNK